MTDNMNEFVKKLLASKELQEKFTSLTDLQEAHKLALTVQLDLTLEEFVEGAKEFERYNSSMSELTGEELNKVAGGIGLSGDPDQQDELKLKPKAFLMNLGQ